MAEVDIKCPCPGKPHETDTVILRDKLGLADGAAVQALILRQYRESDASKYADHTGMLAEAYVLRGVSSWTLVNAAGSALPVNADNIRAMLLDDFEVGYPVAEKADELYEGPVIRPLLKEESNSSEPTPTKRIDVSDVLGGHASDDGVPTEAVEALLDYHYPDGRHRDDYGTARWRLQLLAELGVGRKLREAQAREDAAVAQLQSKMGSG
jgi:hypothetical protein